LTSIASSSVGRNPRGGHHRLAVDVPAQHRVRELLDHIRVSAALVNTLDAIHVEAIADPAPPWIGDDPNQHVTPLTAPLPASMRVQHGPHWTVPCLTAVTHASEIYAVIDDHHPRKRARRCE